MRPTYGRSKLSKEGWKVGEQTEDYDFMTTNDKPLAKRSPITKGEAGPLETREQKFERFLRQVSRCIYSCSLCELGDSEVFHNNVYYDPHCSTPINYNKIAFIKYMPSKSDIANGLFGDFKDICNKIGIKFDSIYKTSIKKCHGESKYKCPYFDLEIEASKDLLKLIVIFDKESAYYLGLDFKPGKLDKYHQSRIYYCDNNPEQILKIIKISESNQQIYNNLFV
jgi:hypothetical protein